MQFILIILRLTHIAAGAFWAGSGLMLALVLLPSVQRAGPAAARVVPMAGISKAMGIASMLTTFAGLALYALIYPFSLNWILSPTGLAFTIGSLAGVAAFFLGMFHTKTAAQKVAALDRQMQAASGPPAAELIAEMQRALGEVKTSSMTSTLLTTAALALMAIARYL